MISSCGVIAMPTSADWGVPSPEMLDTTPKRCRTMNACKAIRSIVELLNFHGNYSPHRYGWLCDRKGYRPTGSYWSSIDERLTDGLPADGLATMRPEPERPGPFVLETYIGLISPVDVPRMRLPSHRTPSGVSCLP